MRTERVTISCAPLYHPVEEQIYLVARLSQDERLSNSDAIRPERPPGFVFQFDAALIAPMRMAI